MALLNKFVSAPALATVIAASTVFSVANAADLSEVPSGAYVVDPSHAFIHFQYNHLGFSNPTLSFDDFEVDLNLDAADATKSNISVKIDASSVQAGSDMFKEHLSGGDFFDISNHPEITYQSTSIEAAGDGYKVMGDLTIKGKSVPVALDVTINGAKNHPMSGKPVIGLDASTMVLRSAFGLDKFLPFVGDEVSISISVEMKKAS